MVNFRNWLDETKGLIEDEQITGTDHEKDFVEMMTRYAAELLKDFSTIDLAILMEHFFSVIGEHDPETWLNTLDHIQRAGEKMLPATMQRAIINAIQSGKVSVIRVSHDSPYDPTS